MEHYAGVGVSYPPESSDYQCFVPAQAPIVTYESHFSFLSPCLNAAVYFGNTAFQKTNPFTMRSKTKPILAASSGTKSDMPFISPPPKKPKSALKYKG